MKQFIHLSLIFLLSFSVLFAVNQNNLKLKPRRVATSKNTFEEVNQNGKLPDGFNSIIAKRLQTNGTRFTTIKVDATIAKNEIDFWSRQLSEHALFLHLGLEDKALKQQGLVLHNKFENFRKNMNNLLDILPLSKELRDYKVKVLSTLNSGKWIGWIFPLFARHILLELDYFIDKLNGIKYSDRDEVAFWNMVNGEHAGFAAHLLDPSERELFEKADKLSQQIEKIVKTEKEMFVQISLQSAKELDQYNRKAQNAINNNQVKSVIHPVLIDHVIREGQRSIQMFNTLTNKADAIYPEDISQTL